MKIGQRMLFRDTPDNPGGADRLSSIEQRLSKLTDAVTTVVTSAAQRQKDDEKNSEVTKAANLVAVAESKANAAKNELTAAYESGEAAKIAEATAKVAAMQTEATAARMNLGNVRQRAAAPPTPAPTQQQQVQQDDTNLREFKARNEWYDNDPDLTAAAKIAHREIAAEKILDVGSKAYFNAIEARVRAAHPDRLPASTNGGGGFTPSKGTTMGNRTGDDGGADRISASVAEGYRRMGIDVDNPDVAKQMVAARKVAVNKGFLPEKPVTDRVLTR